VGCQETGEAIVIDPGREVEPYLSDEFESGLGLHVVAAAETHIHNDILSGTCELAARVDARLYLSGETDEDSNYHYLLSYDHELVRNGNIFNIGHVKFEAIHTPGHTPEHISFLMTNTSIADQPTGIFTGDAVIIGSAVRPDFLESTSGTPGTMVNRARQIFNTMQPLKSLPDYMLVWPAHGTQTYCDKALGGIPTTTVGYERRHNWVNSHSNEDDFLNALLREQAEVPPYFARLRQPNRDGPPVLYETATIDPLRFEKLERVIAEEDMVIDTRTVQAFGKNHFPGTINIPHGLDFATWTGWLTGCATPFYLIAARDHVDEMAIDLFYIGLDNVAGYFETSILQTWVTNGKPIQSE
jgi:hydroxyacylglutathione hydrolase